MILDIYKDSLKYPINNSKALFYFGLTLFSIFVIWVVYASILFYNSNANINLKIISSIIPIILTVISLFLFLGYEYKILKISIHGMINKQEKAPEFNDLKEMLKNGAKIFGVKFTYFIIPVIILAITNIKYLNSISGGVIGTIGASISIILGIVLYFISFISLSNMVAHDEFKKAFDINEIKEVILTIGIARYIIFYIGLLILECTITFILFTILIIAIMDIETSGIFALTSMEALWWTIFILTNLIISLIIALVKLFKTRGIGLIYETIEK